MDCVAFQPERRLGNTQSLLFVLHKAAHFHGQNDVAITMSDVFEATSETVEVYQATTVKLNDSCALNPYAVDVTEQVASFLVICH